MLPTLQWYIFREMGKTFLLAAIGLTAVLGLGGGVMNLIDLERVTPLQLVRLMTIVLPVAGSLTLPVAALYSATVTYGRLSADNELVACRSSGINIHRLFLGPVTLSLLVSACTFYFSSFLVPGLIRDLNTLARVDPRQFVVQRLDSPKRLGFPGMRVKIYADRAASARNDPSAITLGGVAFLEADEGAVDRGSKETGAPDSNSGGGGGRYLSYGTAEAIVIRFSRTDRGATAIGGEFVNATLFDVEGGTWAEAGKQTFGPTVLPDQIRSKVKWLDLRELMHYRRHPEGWPKVAEALASVRGDLVRERYIARVWSDFKDDSQLTLSDPAGTVRLWATEGTLEAEGDAIAFSDVRVIETRGGRGRRITGSGARLEVERPSEGGLEAGVLRIIGNVVVVVEDDGGREERKGHERLPGVAVGADVVGSVSAMSDASLLSAGEDTGMGATAAGKRRKAMHEARKFVRRVTSELHSRLAFSVSVLVLVLLAASLGVVFRGSHVLAAFGISFVPALGVIVMNIMGRQLAEKEGTVLLGLFTIWGSIGVVALLDVWLLGRVVRR